MIKDVDDDLVDEFLLLKAFNSDDPKLYVSLMNDKQGKYHMIGLYLLARHELDKNNQQGYENILDEISKYGPFEDIDFKHLLEISMKDEWGFYKEYLINPCLKVAKKHQNIFFIKYISKKISEVLEDNKRYKDALNYLNQADKHVDKIKYNY